MMNIHHISLGENCLVDHILEKFGLKQASYTFGAVRTNIEYNMQILEEEFENLLKPEYLYKNEEDLVKNNYYNENLGIYFRNSAEHFEFTHHDILDDPQMVSSYVHKVSRFKKILHSNEPIMFWYYHRSNEKEDLSKIMVKIDQLFELMDRKYPRDDLRCVVIHQKLHGDQLSFTFEKKGNIGVLECYDNQLWAIQNKHIFATTFNDQ